MISASGTAARIAAATEFARSKIREATRTRAPSRQKLGYALTDRAGSAQDEGLAARQIDMLFGCQDGGRRRRVGAVGIHHHRNAHRTEKDAAHFVEESLPLFDVAAPDEDRGMLQVGRTARKDRAVDEPLHVLDRDAAVAEQLLHSGIDRHHAVKHAGERIGIEVDQDATHEQGTDSKRRMTKSEGEREPGRHTFPHADFVISISATRRSRRGASPVPSWTAFRWRSARSSSRGRWRAWSRCSCTGRSSCRPWPPSG